MDKNEIILSVVVPVYNSEATLAELTGRLKAVLANLTGTGYQIIYVNDGSADSSWNIIKGLAENDPQIYAINLTRNFGQHNALMCGLSQALGKYSITIDDDLQNPPEEIPKLFEKIQEDYDVVYGVPNTKHHPKYRNIGSKAIQLVYQKTFKTNASITSFRIITRQTVQNMMGYEKSFTFIDGVISWFTSNIGNVFVEHKERKQGGSGYSFPKLVVLAINLLTNFSISPLQIASLTGLFFSIVGFLIGSYYMLKKLFFDIPISGFASIVVSVTILMGVQLLTTGILGEYIGRIHINVNNRPQYVIREIVKSEKDS